MGHFLQSFNNHPVGSRCHLSQMTIIPDMNQAICYDFILL